MDEFILQNSMEGPKENSKSSKSAPIDNELLKKYIKYARRKYFPLVLPLNFVI